MDSSVASAAEVEDVALAFKPAESQVGEANDPDQQLASVPDPSTAQERSTATDPSASVDLDDLDVSDWEVASPDV